MSAPEWVPVPGRPPSGRGQEQGQGQGQELEAAPSRAGLAPGQVPTWFPALTGASQTEALAHASAGALAHALAEALAHALAEALAEGLAEAERAVEPAAQSAAGQPVPAGQ